LPETKNVAGTRMVSSTLTTSAAKAGFRLLGQASKVSAIIVLDRDPLWSTPSRNEHWPAEILWITDPGDAVGSGLACPQGVTARIEAQANSRDELKRWKIECTPGTGVLLDGLELP
jgi:hypothetical protein